MSEKLKEKESYIYGDFRIIAEGDTIIIHTLNGSICVMPFSENKIAIAKPRY